MKLLICDKDGTLVKPKSGNTFVQHPEDQELIPGVADRIAEYKATGWAIAIASNQGGVAAGHKTLDSAIEEMVYACKLVGVDTALFAHSYETAGYGECVRLDLSDGGLFWKVVTNGARRFRKPNPGMIDWLAMHYYGSRLWKGNIEVFAVGDRPEDEQAAQAAGVAFMWANEWRQTAIAHSLPTY